MSLSTSVYRRYLVLAWGVLVLATAVSSCAHSPWQRTVINSGDGVAIYREKLYDDSGNSVALGHAHPVDLSPEQLHALLADLTFARSRILVADFEGPVFSRGELHKLVERLSSALGSLTPNERVRFLSVKERGVLFLNSKVGTSGVVFATAPGELNVAFDMVGDTFDSTDGDPENVRFDIDPTARAEASFRIIPPGSARIKDASQPNWLIFDSDNPPPPVVADEETAEAAPQSTSAPAAAPPAPGMKFLYKGFTIVEHEGKFYAFARSEGPFDSERLKRDEYKTLITRSSVEDLVETITALIKTVEKRAGAEPPKKN